MVRLPPMARGSAPRCPPLSCRTSPPQGGRLAASPLPPLLKSWPLFKPWRLAARPMTANLPPCGGDVRQDRGGRCPASLSAMHPHRFTSQVVTRSPDTGSLPSLSWMPCARSSSRMLSASAQFLSRMKARRAVNLIDVDRLSNPTVQHVDHPASTRKTQPTMPSTMSCSSASRRIVARRLASSMARQQAARTMRLDGSNERERQY